MSELKHDLVILYSGGADSRLMLEFSKMLKRNPYFILIDYGQKHIEELTYATKHLLNTGMNYQIIKIDNLNINSGLTGELKEGRWENVHSMNVPFRNSMFLTIAASIAEDKAIDEIWIGADFDDRINLFPDCYQDYIVKMNELFKIAGAKPLKIIAPLLGFTKDMVIKMLKNLDIDINDVYSGYVPPTEVK